MIHPTYTHPGVNAALLAISRATHEYVMAHRVPTQTYAPVMTQVIEDARWKLVLAYKHLDRLNYPFYEYSPNFVRLDPRANVYAGNFAKHHAIWAGESNKVLNWENRT